MRNRFMKRAVIGALAAAAALLAGTAQAALQNRDLNGDGQTDAFYDTDLNITWLRDADVNGLKQWGAAVTWADTFSFGGYTDWRLPTSDTCQNLNCAGSEMGHLWYVELGNTAGALTNTGNFQNFQSYAYWSGTEVSGVAQNAYYFYNAIGGQYGHNETDDFYAMAVRDGDVTTAVPEPETYVLMLGGLAAMVLAIRRKRR